MRDDAIDVVCPNCDHEFQVPLGQALTPLIDAEIDRQVEAQRQQIVDETRSELSRQLLAHTRLGVGDVGEVVGYADPSAFTRAFVRWTGMKPSEWRVGGGR